MSRFIIQKSESRPGHWVCSDTINNLVCIFKQGKFNDTQQFSLLNDLKQPDPNKLAKAANEMAAWLLKNHHDKIF